MNLFHFTSSEHKTKILIIVIFSAILYCCDSKKEPAKKPNIILFLIDDLGYGDLGCYGNTTVLTPNIDKLASEGMRFTDFHSNGPMCTPTRAALLTGKYQNRFGKKFEGPLSGKTQYDEGLPLEAVTIPEMLKKKGYATGMFGKWHLGYKEPYLPTNQGFDEFAGLAAGDGDHHSHIDRWGREDWWNNDVINMEEGYSVDLITNHSMSFIQEHKEEPFFLYIAHLAIHFPWQGPKDPLHRESGNSYEDDKWGIIPDQENVHPHIKGMVESVDESVGKILNTLNELNLDKNTLIVFTSDNGGYIHYNNQFHNISSNGPLRGQKTEMYEGGHRVPFIAHWPGKIKENSISNETAMTFDLFPTFLQLAGGVKEKNTLSFDGLDLSSQLLNKTPLPQRTLFWKMDDEIAVRQGPWKLVSLSDNPIELYDLESDLGETRDVSNNEKHLTEELWNQYLEWEKDMKPDLISD